MLTIEPSRDRGAEDLARQHGAVEVEPHDLVERVRRQLEEGRVIADRRGRNVASRGVDEDVDPAEAFEHGCASVLELRRVEHVGLEDDRRRAEVAGELFERLAPAREQPDLRACCGEAARDRATEHARRACHDRDPAVEAEQFGQGGGGHRR